MKKILTLSLIFLFVFSGLSLFGCTRAEETDTDVKGRYENEKTAENGATADETEDGKNEDSGTEIPAGGETTVDDSLPSNIGKAVYIRSKCNGLNVRKGAGTGYGTLGMLDKGDMVMYTGKEDGWYKTVYKGVDAYVSASEIYTELYKTDKTDDRIEKVIETGCELLGTEYVYGAVRLHDGYGNLIKSFDITEFDCSSLMQYIFYYGADEVLQVNTRTQVYQGKEVEKADLKRGDLMFFTNASRYYKTGTERIGHVALYLGDGYILHTASDHAVIEKISQTRDSYFICGRRIIDV